MIIPMTLAQKKKMVANCNYCHDIICGWQYYWICNWLFFYQEIGIHIFEFYGFEGFKSFKDQVQVGKGFWAWIILLAIAGFTPVPFKLLTISSGLIHFNFFIFILVATLTRGSRFLF